MKALKNFFMVLLATAILFGFASCSSDDDDSEEQNISSSTNENDPLKGTTWVLVESGITQYELIFDSDGTSVLKMSAGVITIPKDAYTVSKDGEKYVAKCARNNILAYTFTIDSAAVKTGTLTFDIKSDEGYTLSKK